MILSKIIKIKVNANNIKNLTLNGYLNINYNEIIEIDVNHLSIGSHVRIEVQCDICGKIRNNLMYKEYIRNLKSGGYYSCQGKCSSNKNRETCLEKYGVDNPLKSQEIKDKVKATNLKNYGVEYYSSTDESKLKIKNTCLEKYGVDNPSNVKEFKDKRKETMLERHGVEYYVLSKEFKDKSEKTSLKNCGFIHPMMIRYNVERILKSKGLKFETNEYKIYQNKVYNLTSKNKKELLENWDGTDYYDGEYIKENFKLKGTSADYPTIDHKLCIYEGFKNNLHPEELAKIENLCITKRKINSSKYNKTDWTYKGQCTAEYVNL